MKTFSLMDKELMSCSGGTLGLKVEYGLAPPPHYMTQLEMVWPI